MWIADSGEVERSSERSDVRRSGALPSVLRRLPEILLVLPYSSEPARLARPVEGSSRCIPGAAGTGVLDQLLSPFDDNYFAGHSRHARNPWGVRQSRVPTDPDRRPARATPRSPTRQGIPATRPATAGTVPATPGAFAPRHSTVAGAISGPMAGGTGCGARRPCAAPGNVPAAVRSSGPCVYPAPLRNGPGKAGKMAASNGTGDLSVSLRRGWTASWSSIPR